MKIYTNLSGVMINSGSFLRVYRPAHHNNVLFHLGVLFWNVIGGTWHGGPPPIFNTSTDPKRTPFPSTAIEPYM